MELGYILTGATLSFAGLITLLSFSYRQGWLHFISSRFFPSSDSLDRATVEKFIKTGRSIRDSLKGFANSYRSPEYTIDALMRLRGFEIKGYIGDIVTVLNDVEQTFFEFKKVCVDAIKTAELRGFGSGAGIGANTLGNANAASMNGATGTAGANGAQDNKTTTDPKIPARPFDPNAYYCVRRTSPGAKAENVTGAYIHSLMDQGFYCPRDFWVMGFTHEFAQPAK